MQSRHPLRVAIDGITASGKTTLADELSVELSRQRRQVIRVRMDDFHHLREHRYRQGSDSARGYYDDAYDFEALYHHVLEPLGPDGNRVYRTRMIDLASNTLINEPPEIAEPDDVLVTDGSFMQRLHRNDWDAVIFVNTSFPEALRRGILRDADQFGGTAGAEQRYTQRYHAAARLYLDEINPAHAADFVLDNDDLATPLLRRN